MSMVTWCRTFSSELWAVQTGRDIHVEKPVSHHVSEGRRLVAVARKYGKSVQTGPQCRRSRKGIAAAMKSVQEGHLGICSLSLRNHF